MPLAVMQVSVHCSNCRGVLTGSGRGGSACRTVRRRSLQFLPPGPGPPLDEWCQTPSLTEVLARLRTVVLDCREPRALAEFYRGLLGGEITDDEDDWVTLVVEGRRVAFQEADDFVAPTWRTGERPQQLHLDFTVVDIEAVEPKVLALRATMHEVQPGEAEGDQFRVYLDPAGHPFCLCWD